MNQELNFKVILASIADNSKQMKEVIATLLSTTFNVPESQTIALLTKLPVILFENLSANDLKALKDSLIFLSKLGLDFNVTPKPTPNVPKASWTPSVSVPIITCPSCGEMFCMVRARDFLQPRPNVSIANPVASALPSAPKTTIPEPKIALVQQKQASVALQTPKSPVAIKESVLSKAKEENISKRPTVKQDTPPVPIASLKKAMTEVPKKNISEPKKEIKEPVSRKELKLPDDLVGISSEFENVEVLSAELESIADMEEKNSISDVEEIEEVESISDEVNQVDDLEEFEELEDSSLSKKKPLGKPVEKRREETEAIGGISAEFEEIEGVSAEFERICMEGMENDIGSLSAEMEEIEGISQELDSVEEEGLEKIGEVAETFKKISLTKTKDLQKESQDIELEEMQGISKELEGISDTVASVQMIKKNPLPGEETKKGFSMEPGSYKALINFAGKGNTKAGIQLLGKIKGITEQQAQEMVKNKAAIVVASNISRQSAENIVKEFEKLQMQGKIIAG